MLKTKAIEGSIGSTKTVSRFGWQRIDRSGDLEEAELAVVSFLEGKGHVVSREGKRSQSYDLTSDGLHYEVKSLWRRSSSRLFDRRFKVGSRGERIYGEMNHSVCDFVLALEGLAIDIVERDVMRSFTKGLSRGRWDNFQMIRNVQELVDLALLRKHSRGFFEKLKGYGDLLEMNALNDPISKVVDLYRNMKRCESMIPSLVSRSFSDVDGIYIVAGDNVTLVQRDEIPQFISFFSVGTEGVVLRYEHDVPR
jgi:hypothetical protein